MRIIARNGIPSCLLLLFLILVLVIWMIGISSKSFEFLFPFHYFLLFRLDSVVIPSLKKRVTLFGIHRDLFNQDLHLRFGFLQVFLRGFCVEIHLFATRLYSSESLLSTDVIDFHIWRIRGSWSENFCHIRCISLKPLSINRCEAVVPQGLMSVVAESMYQSSPVCLS